VSLSSAAKLTARDLCLQVEQYVILNLSSISLTPLGSKRLDVVIIYFCDGSRFGSLGWRLLVSEHLKIVNSNVRHRKEQCCGVRLMIMLSVVGRSK
jgi:hypothetical protein